MVNPEHLSPQPPTARTAAPPHRPRGAAATALLSALLASLLAPSLTGSLTVPASAGLLRGAAAGSPPVSTAPGPRPGARTARARGARFQLATFNILGSNHTRNSRRYARGVSRARTTSRIIQSRGTDVIGMQEVQDDQLRVLSRKLHGFTIWPKHRLGNNGVRLQIAWRAQRFAHVRDGHITTTFSRQQRPVPWVLLRDRRTGARFFVVTIHNSPGNQERARDRATRKEIRLVKRLRRSGKPVFIVGDTNEHSEFFCKVGRATSLRAPQGGNPDARGCRKPRNPRLLIDWIMGGGKVHFVRYSQRRSRMVRRASDHHYVQTTARVRR